MLRSRLIRTVAAPLAILALVLGGAAATGSPGLAAKPTGATGPTGPSTLAPPPTTYYRAIGCRLQGPAIAHPHGPARKLVALSFDDGPWSDTPSFVHMIARNRAVATFFMIGRQVTAAYATTLQAELRYGDALGNHTFTHPNLTGVADIAGQLQPTQAVIERLTGYTPCVFRPPYGAYDARVIGAARALGLATVLWDVDPSDYTQPGVAAIEQRVLAQVRPGSIIISHDGGGPRGQTLAAYPAIIAALRARGYRFETVPQLLGLHTVYLRCTRNCRNEGVTAPLPAGSIVLGH